MSVTPLIVIVGYGSAASRSEMIGERKNCINVMIVLNKMSAFVNAKFLTKVYYLIGFDDMARVRELICGSLFQIFVPKRINSINRETVYKKRDDL